jgi:hypothetical protein
MWKVLLLGDDEYEEDPVCGVIVEVLPDLPIDEVRQKYKEAQVCRAATRHASADTCALSHPNALALPQRRTPLRRPRGTRC